MAHELLAEVRGSDGVAGKQADEFVGRRFELEALEKAINSLAGGEPRVVQIFGEPGVGKTRLIAEAVDRARERGYVALQGRGTEYEREVPFAALVGALDPYLEEMSPQDFARLGEERVAELARVFPSLMVGGEMPAVAGFGERYLLYRAVSQLISLIAESQPLVLALDDLHWADSASIELIMHLLDRGLDGEVLMLIAFRRPSISPQLAACLDSTLQKGTVSRLALRPLSRDEATRLCSQLDNEAVDRIYRETGGNPFYLEQLTRSHDAQQGDPGDEPQDVSIVVRTAIEREIEALEPQARLVVDAAAVAGEQFDPELLGAIARLPEWNVLEVIDGLGERDLLRPAGPRQFRFRHPIVRRSVYESVGNGWRLGAHARAAAELKRRGAPVTALAHHVERGAKVGDLQAAELLAEAGQAAAPRAPVTAAAWFAAALSLMPESADHEMRRLELLAARAIALGAAGQVAEAREALHAVLDRLPPEMTALRVEVTRFAAVFEMLSADHRNARRLLTDALAQLDDQDPEAVTLMSELANVSYFSVDIEELLSWSQRALGVGGTNEPLNVATMGMLAHAHFARGEMTEARSWVATAATRLDGLSDEDIAARPDCALWVGVAELLTESLPDAQRHFDRGVKVARAFGQGHYVMLALAGQAWTLARMGRLEESIGRAQEAIESGQLVGNLAPIKAGLATHSASALWCGTLDEATALAQRSFELTQQSTGAFDEAAVVALGEVMLEHGDAAGAREVLRAPEAVELERRLAPVEYRRIEMLTRACVELGDLEEAERYASEAEFLAESRDLDGWRCEAHRARAYVMAAEGNPAGAAREAESSVECAAKIGAQLDCAKGHALAGTMWVEAGEVDRGREALERAERAFAAIGGWRGRDRVVLQLRKLGVHVTTRKQRSPNGSAALSVLTPRELQVAEMLPAGKTNREIAAELSLSVRTVERHVGNVLEKLQLSSRAAVASLVERTRG